MLRSQGHQDRGGPWLVGWILSSLWAGRPLDPMPFVAGYVSHQLLRLALMLPIVVIAGWFGNSLVGAAVVTGSGLVAAQFVLGRLEPLLGVAGLSLPQLLLGDGEPIAMIIGCCSLLAGAPRPSRRVGNRFEGKKKEQRKGAEARGRKEEDGNARKQPVLFASLLLGAFAFHPLLVQARYEKHDPNLTHS